jgi:hypothetical protein
MTVLALNREYYLNRHARKENEMEKYEIFQAVVNNVRDGIEKGQDVSVPLKELSTMSKIYVRAIIAEKTEDLKGGETLRVVNDMGEKVGAMFVSIKAELSDEEVSALPTQ